MIKPKYYLVERTLLPEVFQRVIEANEAIASGKAATASEAAKIAGLSRSAYYKYKDGVRPFFEATTDRIVTYHFMLHDQPGVLSSILGLMARSGANLLTVNQSIPMRGMASSLFRPAPVRWKLLESEADLCTVQKQWKASAKWKFWHLNDRPAVYRNANLTDERKSAYD